MMNRVLLPLLAAAALHAAEGRIMTGVNQFTTAFW
jgi:hypothetical protein